MTSEGAGLQEIAGARIRAVFFDFDGTLVDSEPLIGAALSEVLARHGFQFDPADVGRVVGPPMSVMIERITGCSSEEAAALYAEYQQCYLDEHAPRTVAYPGAVELLDALAAAGIPLAMVTNKHLRSASRVLGYLGWAERFQALVCADNAPRPKPYPEHALEAARLLGVTPEESALVGDLEVDMACGKDAGLARVIGFAHITSRGLLEGAGATHVVTSLFDIPPLLGLPPLVSSK